MAGDSEGVEDAIGVFSADAGWNVWVLVVANAVYSNAVCFSPQFDKLATMAFAWKHRKGKTRDSLTRRSGSPAAYRASEHAACSEPTYLHTPTR